MTLRSNPDKITYDAPPKYLKNAEGRVFIATESLIKLGTMEACDNPDGTNGVIFNSKKASKQQIADAAKENYGVDLEFGTLKAMRAAYADLEADGEPPEADGVNDADADTVDDSNLENDDAGNNTNNATSE